MFIDSFCKTSDAKMSLSTDSKTRLTSFILPAFNSKKVIAHVASPFEFLQIFNLRLRLSISLTISFNFSNELVYGKVFSNSFSIILRFRQRI